MYVPFDNVFLAGSGVKMSPPVVNLFPSKRVWYKLACVLASSLTQVSGVSIGDIR